jgi:superfamily II DNA/RNA helicase
MSSSPSRREAASSNRTALRAPRPSRPAVLSPAGPVGGEPTSSARSAVRAGFADFGVPAPLVAALAASGILEPFPIQAATLPDALAGRDVLGRGRTGSGKTIAFALPLLAALARSGVRPTPGAPRGLVLVPTRELANQIAEVIDPLAATMGLRYTTIFGGVGEQRQIDALRRGVDLVIACPGRLDDLTDRRFCRLDRVEVTVLDEADHMADLGFLPVVRRLLDATPQQGQRLLFSATLDNGIDVLVRRFLHDPVVHSVDPPVAPVTTMVHHVFAVSAADKASVLSSLAAGRDRSLLFTRTKHGAKKLAKQLTTAGIPAVELHGNLSQAARERNLQAFTDGTSTVLVATDIAARGIHVDDVGIVIHVDPPAEHKAYVHRSGRTARAGADGVVVTLMTPDQVADVRALTRAAKVNPTVTRVIPGHALITELVGEPAPRVEPTAARAVATAPQRDRRPGANPSSAGGSGSQGRSQGGAHASSHVGARGSGASRSGGSRSGASRSGASRSGASRSGASRSGASRSGGRGRPVG